MSIGGALAEARQRAGLTIADVSAHTRIRPPIIRAIERDDFGACGGDFYARGHIRAIARAVGLDPGPLVSQYDAARLPAQGPAHPHAGGPGDGRGPGRFATMEDLLGQERPRPQEQQPAPERSSGLGRHASAASGTRARWGSLAVLIAALVVISLGSYRLASAGGSGQRLASAAGAGQPTTAPRSAPSSAASSRPSPAASSPPASPSPHPSHAASPVREVKPVSAAAFGPGGTSDGDNPQNASLALSGDPSTPWHTDWYTTARFGNLQSGTGLLLDMGKTVTVTGVTIRLGSATGADLQVRGGTSPGSLSTVASASGAGGTVTLHLSAPAHVRYLVIWFTLLPPDSTGTYQADISGVTVAAK